MIYNVYAIRDQYTGFLTPTVEGNDAAAKRNFEHAMSNPQSLLYTHAKDYDLMRIGTYDSDTGEIVGQLPVVIMAGSDVVRKDV